jgi:hypothetical protein
VIWFFRREAERTSYEIRVAYEEGAYELIVRSPAGDESQERFTSGAQLLKRREELDQSLREQGWHDENEGLCGESSRRLYAGRTRA